MPIKIREYPVDVPPEVRLRFWAKVAQTGNVCECWEWTAAKVKTGYGAGYTRFNLMGMTVPAHRVAASFVFGVLPVDRELDHLCSNRGCVNPWHLELVTRKVNNQRIDPASFGGFYRAKTHCPQGHPYDEENTYKPKNKINRMCRVCMRERRREWGKKKRTKNANHSAS